MPTHVLTLQIKIPDTVTSLVDSKYSIITVDVEKTQVVIHPINEQTITVNSIHNPTYP